jgi:deoxycytidine triphosphate deaminase
MVLGHEQIRRIVRSITEEHLSNASYDLTAKQIYDMDGKAHDFYKIPSQGMAYVVFAEELELDNKTIGFAHVKTSLTQKGILAINIGIIDPGYKGFMSTLLMNFGNNPFTIEKGMPYLRVTFNRVLVETPLDVKHKELDYDSYSKARRKDTDNFDNKFLNLGSVTKEVLSTVTKWLLGFGALFTAASFGLGFYFQHKTSSDKSLDNSIKSYQTQAQVIAEENKFLSKKVELLENSLNNNNKLLDSLLKKRVR